MGEKDNYIGEERGEEGKSGEEYEKMKKRRDIREDG